MATIDQVMKVEINEDHIRYILQPIVDEVNALRTRVRLLELAAEGEVDDGR